MIFSPGIYEHAAALIGKTPWEVSRDLNLLSEAHCEAWGRYRHPIIVAGIDVYNVEPEAYGAVITKPSGHNIPSIAKYPCEEVEELFDLPPLDPFSSGRIPDTLAAGMLLKEKCKGAQVHIPVCGPLALAIGLIGMNEVLMAVVEDPDELQAALKHLLKGQKAFLQRIHDSELNSMIFESGTTPPLLSPESFRIIEAPLLAELFDFAKTLSGKAPACVIGGNSAPIAAPFLEAGPGWVIAPSETNQIEFLECARAFPDIHVRINLPATLLLEEDHEKIKKEAQQSLKLAASRENTSIGCGVVPFETNPDTVLFLKHLLEESIIP